MQNAKQQSQASESAQIKSEGISIQIPVGTWVDIEDQHGYPCMNGCGIVATSFPDGHVTIKNWEGLYFSSAAFVGKTITAIAKGGASC